MHLQNARAQENDGRALYLVGLTVLLVTFLVALSAILGKAASRPDPVPAAGGEGGGGGLVHFVPGGPSPVNPVGTFPDGPGVTIVEDVRETMRRLPLDRNNPQGWTNPGVKKKPG